MTELRLERGLYGEGDWKQEVTSGGQEAQLPPAETPSVPSPSTLLLLCPLILPTRVDGGTPTALFYTEEQWSSETCRRSSMIPRGSVGTEIQDLCVCPCYALS